MTTRRDFLRTTCSFCLATAALGLVSTLEGCAGIPVVKASEENKQVKVPLSSFKELPYVIVRRQNMMTDDLLLVKKSDGTFYTLLLQCTHQAQPLTVSGKSINCAAHGSSFDLEGNVTHDPATRPLTKYNSVQDGEYVLITVS